MLDLDQISDSSDNLSLILSYNELVTCQRSLVASAKGIKQQSGACGTSTRSLCCLQMFLCRTERHKTVRLTALLLI